MTLVSATRPAQPQPSLGPVDAGPPTIQALGPGEPDDVPVVAAACPTFHWGVSAERIPAGIELRVSRLIEATDQLETQPILERRLSGQSRLWTPYVGECLKPGGLYAWWVRILDGEGEPGPWSEARFFQVLEKPETAGAEPSLPPGVGKIETREDRGAESGRTTARRHSGTREHRATASSASLAGAAVSVYGKRSETSGNAIGVVGESASPDGAGIAAANAASGGGPDLLLDGAAQGLTDTVLTESGLDRPSTGAEVFDFTNSGAGSMTLRVNGTDVLTSTSSVDWSSLVNVPADLEDGDDDTTYMAGTGLALSGSTFSVDGTAVAYKDSAAGDQAFDGGTLFLDYDLDRVGIGETAPGHALDVNGDIRADAYRYRSPVTRYHSVPGVDFHPEDATLELGYSEWSYSYTTDPSQVYRTVAPVHLPDGATVTAFTCYTYDNDADNSPIWTFNLWNREHVEPGSATEYAEVTINSGGATDSMLTATDDTINDGAVDNQISQLLVYLDYDRDVGTSNTQSLRNYGCRIEYTIDVVSTP